MLSAIKDLGKFVIDNNLAISSPMRGVVLSIVIDVKNASFAGIDIEDFDSKKLGQYLFKQGASKGNAPSPFCPLTKPQKTLKKIARWLKQCNELSDLQKNDMLFLNQALEILKANEGGIVSEIEKKSKNLLKKKGEANFLTLKFNDKYIGEYEIFNKCLITFNEAKRKKSASLGTCSICGLPGKEVSGKTDVYKFYTIDKPGFIIGGFQESLAWKNFPVCQECKISLEKGKEFLENHLSFNFYGLGYYLIPRFLIGNGDELKEILQILSDTTKAVSLKGRIKKRITSDENEILEYISEKKDILSLTFLFLRRDQSAERILLLIEDVFPSRIRKIFEGKEYVERIFAEEFNFGKIRTFFSKSDESKRQSDLNEYFLAIVDSIFKDRELDFSFLSKFYMAVIRKEFIKDGYFYFRIKDSLMDTMFFENLGLITFKEVENMEESIFDSIFARYGKSLGSPIKRGIFLLGALTQLLLNKQWSERNAKPFMKKLKGLKMDEKDIKALLPEVQNKLEEYNAFDKGKKLVAAEASKYLLEAGDIWKMSIDEINYYFACGMNLAESVANIVYSVN